MSPVNATTNNSGASPANSDLARATPTNLDSKDTVQPQCTTAQEQDFEEVRKKPVHKRQTEKASDQATKSVSASVSRSASAVSVKNYPSLVFEADDLVPPPSDAELKSSPPGSMGASRLNTTQAGSKLHEAHRVMRTICAHLEGMHFENNLDHKVNSETLLPCAETQCVYKQCEDFFSETGESVKEYLVFENECSKKTKIKASSYRIRDRIKTLYFQYLSSRCSYGRVRVENGIQILDDIIPKLFLNDKSNLDFFDDLLSKGIMAWKDYVEAELMYEDVSLSQKEYEVAKSTGDYLTVNGGEVVERISAFNRSMLKDINWNKEQVQVMTCELMVRLNAVLHLNLDSEGYQSVCKILARHAEELVPLLDSTWKFDHEIRDPRICWIYIAACACCGCFRSLRKAAQQLPGAASSASLAERLRGFTINSADFNYALEVLHVCKRFSHHIRQHVLKTESGWMVLKDNYLAWREIYTQLEQHWHQFCADSAPAFIPGFQPVWSRHLYSSDSKDKDKGSRVLAEIQQELSCFEQDIQHRIEEYESHSKIETQNWLEELEIETKQLNDRAKQQAEQAKLAYLSSLSKTARKKRKKKEKSEAACATSPDQPSVHLSLIELGIQNLENARGNEAEKLFTKVVEDKQSSPIDKAWALLFLGNLALRACPDCIKICYQNRGAIIKYHAAVSRCIDDKEGLPDQNLYQSFLKGSEGITKALNKLTVQVQISKNFYDKLYLHIFNKDEVRNNQALLSEVHQISIAEHPELDRVKKLCDIINKAQEDRKNLLVDVVRVKSAQTSLVITNRERLENVMKSVERFRKTVMEYRAVQEMLS